VHRSLQCIPYSKFIDKKQGYHLISLNNSENSICFALSLTAFTTVRDLRDKKLLRRAKELPDKQGWPEHRKLMLNDIPLIADLQHINVCIIVLSEIGEGEVKQQF